MSRLVLEISNDVAESLDLNTLLERQLLNPERHLQAAKAMLVEVTKATWEKSLIVKAIVTYLDKLSETLEQGA